MKEQENKFTNVMQVDCRRYSGNILQDVHFVLVVANDEQDAVHKVKNLYFPKPEIVKVTVMNKMVLK